MATDSNPPELGSVVGADLVPSLPTSIEQTAAKRRLARAVVERLSGEDAFLVRHNNIERHGLTRVIVVDSEDGKTHITLDAGKQGGNRPDHVRVKWIDEGDKVSGSVWWTDKGYIGLPYTSNIVPIKDDERLGELMDRWRETGGYDMMSATDKPVPEEQLDAIAAKLEGGHINIELTNAALNYLTTKLGSARVLSDQLQSFLGSKSTSSRAKEGRSISSKLMKPNRF